MTHPFPHLATVALLALLPVLVALTACGGDVCAEGDVVVDGRCVPAVDAGELDSSDDAGDSGGCAPACTPPEVCDGASGECVRCRGEGDCGGDTPHCVANECVACRDAMDCDASAPACTPNTCVACTGDSDCTRFTDTPLCGTDGECVACTEAADCTDVANARCDPTTNSCAPCTMDADCPGTGENVCLTEGPDAGTCVQCRAGEETACGGNVCNVAAHTCTTTPAGMTGLCGDCVSDRQCNEGQLCVPMIFGAAMTPVGNHCLWREDATVPLGPMGACSRVRPYVRGEDATSVGGTATRVCGLRRTTCAALAHFSMQSCTTPVVSDDMCGVPGLDDGYCRVLDIASNRCTIGCLSIDDCKDGSTCDTGVTPNVCRF